MMAPIVFIMLFIMSFLILPFLIGIHFNFEFSGSNIFEFFAWIMSNVAFLVILIVLSLIIAIIGTVLFIFSRRKIMGGRR